jgi:hypothetical protein
MVIHDEGVVQEDLEQMLEPSRHVEIALWRHYVSGLLRELESVLDLLALVCTVKNFEGEEEL